MPITFAKPPINEVVLGHVFPTRQDFLIPHFGKFWETISDAYPKVQHAPPIVDSGQTEPPADPASGLFLPRVWYLSEDETRLVQLQQDRLHVNWRQTPEFKGEYPRFPAILSEFERVANLFDKFLMTALGQPMISPRLELTYINIIALNDVGIKGVEDFHRVINCFRWDSRLAIPAPKKFSSVYRFEPDAATELTIRINSASRVSDGESLLKMELTTKEIPGIKTRDQWIEDAHQLIVKSFKELTSEEMHHNHWQLISD